MSTVAEITQLAALGHSVITNHSLFEELPVCYSCIGQGSRMGLRVRQDLTSQSVEVGVERKRASGGQTTVHSNDIL